MMRRAISAIALATAAAMSGGAAAQDQGNHQGHAGMERGQKAAREANSEEEAATQETDGNSGHSGMDHSAMDQTAIEPKSTAPASTNMRAVGPISAADVIWGADAMQQSRDDLYAEHGGQRLFWFQADRLEVSISEESEGYLWDVQGYYGGDIHKLWLKSEGEGAFGETVDDAEIQALYSRAIAPFFDLQTGVRQDLTGARRTYAVIGIQGLAPYEFELDAAAFLSTKGDLTVRVEAEYDQRITQRLILQPRAELSLAAQDVPELGIGAGLDSLEAGLRLRYEIEPEFAPYIGVEQSWKFGRSAEFARAADENTQRTSVLVGLRFWF